MTELLVIPPKKGSEVDMTGPLTNWIRSTFGSSEDSAALDVAEFQRLRSAAIRPSDRGENAALACAK